MQQGEKGQSHLKEVAQELLSICVFVLFSFYLCQPLPPFAQPPRQNKVKIKLLLRQ